MMIAVFFQYRLVPIALTTLVIRLGPPLQPPATSVAFNTPA